MISPATYLIILLELRITLYIYYFSLGAVESVTYVCFIWELRVTNSEITDKR
jgi:hypothetical protein